MRPSGVCVIIAILVQRAICNVQFWFSGRVHSAVVSGVNLEQRTVTVEWFERGETKGKEVSALIIVYLAFTRLSARIRRLVKKDFAGKGRIFRTRPVEIDLSSD